MSGSAIHLDSGRPGTLSGKKFTACGLQWAETVQGRQGGSALRVSYETVKDPSIADCVKCLRFAKARKRADHG